MRKIFYLSSCDTCRKIIKSLPNGSDLIYHDIRQDTITVKELEEMQTLAGSYEALFSKRAQLYTERGLKNQTLTEEDLFKLELNAFMTLIETKETQDRIKHTLATGKPLIN